MRFRTLALAVALALGCGAVSAVHAADDTSKRMKKIRKENAKRNKQSNGAQYKPRKAAKTKAAKTKSAKTKTPKMKGAKARKTKRA